MDRYGLKCILMNNLATLLPAYSFNPFFRHAKQFVR
jgi:hypothetical protein